MRGLRIGLLIALIFFASDVYAAPEVSATSSVVLDAKTGIVLFEHNKDQVNYPASITKIMTALLAIENSGGDFDSRVYFSHDAVFSIEAGSSNIAMDEGETLSLDDALYGLMLQSANEVANALAENVSDTTDAFAKKMTERAIELGAVNTHFANPHGLPDENHYTTAYDMALIMREAVMQPKFVELISTQRHDILPTERQPEIRILNNTNKMIWPQTQYYNEWVVGGKTGYTNDARHTLVTYGRRDGMELIVAVMHGEAGEQYTDTAALLEYGFTQFANVEIFNSEEYATELPVIQKTDGDPIDVGTVVVKASRSITRYLPKQAGMYVTTEASLPEYLTAPVSKGDRLGELRIYCNDVLQSVIPLSAVESVAEIAVPQTSAPTPSDGQKVSLSPMVTIGAVIVAVLSTVLMLVSWRVLRGLRVSRH